MTIRIDYYTGTGGSERISRRIADELRHKGCDVSLNRIIRDKFSTEDTFDYYILVFAVHSFNAPRPTFEWVRRLEGKGRKCAVISVSGGGEIISNTACRRKIIKCLSLQKFEVVYEDMVRMPNNWMSVPKPEKCERILKQYPIRSQEIANAIFAQVRRRKSPLWIDILISALGESEKALLKKFGKGIKTLDSCIACGLCAERCASSNIVIENGKAVVGEACDMCLGCIYVCPHKALMATYGSFQIDKKGYDLKLMEKELK